MDYDVQYDKIYRYCYYKVKDKNLAEEITQETFLHFLDSGYREQGKSLQYLYTIARNLCVDHFRRNTNNKQILLNEEPEEPADSGFEEEFGIKSDLQKAMSVLSEEDREILLLKYANDEKDTVICGLFGISRFSLYRRLHRLQKLLRKHLIVYSS
ncbi:MAG: sigma-70 family RNA polymerase sigma factor [Flexilinea sp.]|nr:sigma-70 family RNA polymerase sigma factor [Flexilinea sp.]